MSILDLEERYGLKHAAVISPGRAWCPQKKRRSRRARAELRG